MPWQNNTGGGGWQGGGNRNPWGSGQGGGGPQPPNIDDLIRKGQDRLKNAIPGGFGSKGAILLILVVLAMLWALTGVYTVKAGEKGVVLRFGEYVYSTEPGLNMHLPYPIESHLTPNVQQRRQTDLGFRSDDSLQQRQRPSPSQLEAESLMLTGDENIVDIKFTVFWDIKDPQLYLFNIQLPQEETVKAASESVMREIIGKTLIQQALTEGRQEIESSVQRLVQEVLDEYGTGIRIIEVKLEKVDPPTQVIDAFRDVQAAEADRETARNEADRYANRIIPEARGDAARMIQDAEAYKEQIIAKSQGEASRFIAVYNQYALAKDITRKRIYLETMEEILTGMNKVILDEGAGTGVVPYLPLPEIQKRNNANQGGQ